MDKIAFGFQNCIPYCNTKFMLALFTKNLEKENGINAYALCPGSLNTNIVKKIPLMMKLNVEVPRMFSATPEEVVIKNSLLQKPFCLDNNCYCEYFKLFQVASEYIMYCALEKSIENETGKMYRYRKQYEKVNKRLDSNLAKRLCEKSVVLVKLNERLARIKNNTSK